MNVKTTRLDETSIRVREATREDIPGIVWVSNESIPPGEDIGFGAGSSPFHEASKLASVWEEPNIVRGEEVLVAEMDGRVVGCVTIQNREAALELVNSDVPSNCKAGE
jgi:hypothetical protein